MSVSNKLAFMLSLAELSSCILREWPFDWLARMGALSPSSSRLVSRISPTLLVRCILACLLAGSWSKLVSIGRPDGMGAGGREEGS